jgi:hypothetical protein
MQNQMMLIKMGDLVRHLYNETLYFVIVFTMPKDQTLPRDQ